MSRPLLWKLCAVLLLVILGLGSALLGIWLRGRHVPPVTPQTVVAFLDVGDGDCTLIRTANGMTVVLDSGGAKSATHVIHVLRRFHVQTIDLLVLTSSGEGSLGGVPALVRAFPVHAVWDTAQEEGSGQVRRQALEAIGRSPRTVYAGDNLQIGASTFWKVLWPSEHGTAARRDGLILEMDYGATRFLFAGTASPDAEGGLVAGLGGDLGCTTDCNDLILQVPRGGASGSASSELLRSAAPSVAVLSCSGAPGMPAQTTLHRLQAAGAEIRRTDTMGTVIVLTDGHAVPTVAAEHL